MCSNTHVVKKLKILLADTRYDTVGAHSNYVPIGIGYIGAYLKEKLKDYDIKKVQYMRNEIKSIYGQNKGYTSSDRAFGRYLMQYIGRGVDVFEKNFQKIN